MPDRQQSSVLPQTIKQLDFCTCAFVLLWGLVITPSEGSRHLSHAHTRTQTHTGAQECMHFHRKLLAQGDGWQHWHKRIFDLVISTATWKRSTAGGGGEGRGHNQQRWLDLHHHHICVKMGAALLNYSARLPFCPVWTDIYFYNSRCYILAAHLEVFEVGQGRVELQYKSEHWKAFSRQIYLIITLNKHVLCLLKSYNHGFTTKWDFSFFFFAQNQAFQLVHKVVVISMFLLAKFLSRLV